MALTSSPEAPQPLRVVVNATKGWVERLDERKVHVRGHCLLGDLVVSEAEAVFVRFSADRQIAGWTPPGTGQG